VSVFLSKTSSFIAASESAALIAPTGTFIARNPYGGTGCRFDRGIPIVIPSSINTVIQYLHGVVVGLNISGISVELKTVLVPEADEAAGFLESA
jgi:hypothetical protein